MAAIYKDMAAVVAIFNTATAAYTIALLIKNFKCRVLGFRIMAPYTVQRASFQKDHGSYTGAVRSGKTLDIEYFPVMMHDAKSS